MKVTKKKEMILSYPTRTALLPALIVIASIIGFATSAQDLDSPKYQVRGQVTDANGRPIAEASVKPDGVATESSRGWGGRRGFPEQVFTDSNGEFVLEREKAFTELQVRVKAEGFAPYQSWLKQDGTVHAVKLGIGANIAGKVVLGEEPMPHMRVGVSGSERSSDVYAGHFETMTDENGEFLFEDLQPNTAWQLYGIIDSFKQHGSLPPRVVSTKEHGETTSLPNLIVQPAVTLEGTIVPVDGATLPDDRPLSVHVSYDTAWDSQQSSIDESGRFQFEGLHRGKVSVSVRAKGWRVTGRNRSIDLYNPWSLDGQLEESKKDLLIEIEQKEIEYNSPRGANGRLPNEDYPSARPLAGIEPGPTLIVVRGHVVDDESGDLISNYEFMPGRLPPPRGRPGAKRLLQRVIDKIKDRPDPFRERPFWYFGRKDATETGFFKAEFQPLTSDPLLQISAPGYEPLVAGPYPATTNGIELRLKRSNGPGGVVLAANGSPAPGAHLIYAAQDEQFGINEKGELNDYRNPDSMLLADEAGTFKFSQRLNGERLFVTHTQGWAHIEKSQLSPEMEIKLLPWAKVAGVLLDANGQPMADEPLSIELGFPETRVSTVHLHFNFTVKTKADGSFRFPMAPPGEITINRKIPWSLRPGKPARGWSSRPQATLYAQPGLVNDLKQITVDSPPPTPAFDKLSKKLGL